MEKNNMQQNVIADDELEQVGGGTIFGLVTTEFKEFFGSADKQDYPMLPEEDDNQYGVGTLEMRIDPKKKNNRNNKNIIKL